jgi:DNA-binding response OmpR family regulator
MVTVSMNSPHVITLPGPLFARLPPASASHRLETTPAHILVVDDDDTIRRMLAEWLSATGYRVSTAENGEAAWEILCADRIDVLITDHDMPRLTGLDLLRRVRSGPLNLPVILISGDMPWNQPDLLSLLPPGIALEKPFTLAELHAQLRSLLPVPASRRDETDGQGLLEFEPASSPLTIRATG